MRRLANARELLDGPLDDQPALDGNLRDLRRVNRFLGGTTASFHAVGALAGVARSMSLLDVGTGGADIPLSLTSRFARHGRELVIVGVDARPEILAAARRLDSRLEQPGPVELDVGDGATLPYPDGSFDVVHSSLVLHHLEPGQAVGFLREARRVARRGVVVNDLVRARRHWVLARLLAAVATRNPMTRHDGPLSVQRAYTRMELRALLAAAGLRPVLEWTVIGGHRVAIAAVPIPLPSSPPAPSGPETSDRAADGANGRGST